MKLLPTFNKYVAFVDEAGDHQFKADYNGFPMFVLTFCIVERQHYAEYLVPKLLVLKFKYFLDSHVIFHESEIRRRMNDFSFLVDPGIREQFFMDMNNYMRDAKITIVACAINKQMLQHQCSILENPYDIATRLCLQKLNMFLDGQNHQGQISISFEGRGGNEDRELRRCFAKVTAQPAYRNAEGSRFVLRIIPKVSNCCGLQLADLIARPIGDHCLNPGHRNRAFDIIKTKFYQKDGEIDDFGLIIVPPESKKPPC